MLPTPDRDAQRKARLDALVAEVRACRLCRDRPRGTPLPHEPRPVLRPSTTARLAVFSQAPGARVHASGVPFSDASGIRLRAWMGVSEAQFYDSTRIAIVPMGFCFPGHDAKGGDLPPRPECAEAWRAALLRHMEQIELALLVGAHAQRWHLGPLARGGLSATVQAWRACVDARLGGATRYLPMPHPSWRNNGWLRRNPVFTDEVLPWLRDQVSRLLA